MFLMTAKLSDGLINICIFWQFRGERCLNDQAYTCLTHFLKRYYTHADYQPSRPVVSFDFSSLSTKINQFQK